MLEALNGLFQRVDTALETERRFTADAAHELRTPLAALQASYKLPCAPAMTANATVRSASCKAA